MNNTKKIDKTYVLEFTIKITLSIVLVALAGRIAVNESMAYYALAPFHYDSATYLYSALLSYDLVHSHGRLFSFLQAIQTNKDFLDLVLRILLAPDFLKSKYGHMAVLLPFMGLFCFLTMHYVFRRTHSWLASIAVVSCLFCMPFIYLPYLGIADYWKESIAIWILGCAVVSWLLSDMLARPWWSLLCSVMLGLLVMERSALAVYIAAMFLPPFVWAVYQRIRFDKAKGLLGISAFVIPAGVLCGLVAWMQWDILYNYYFVKGYDYTSPFRVAKYLLWQVLHYNCFRFPLVLLLVIYCFCFYLNTEWKKNFRDSAITLWFVISFPLIIALTHGLYSGFYNNWTILLILFFATIIPGNMSFTSNYRIFMLVLVSIIITCSITQYSISKNRTEKLIQKSALWRSFYENLTNIILSQPSPRGFNLLFAEDNIRFLDHTRLNRGIAFNQITPVGYMSVHDSYYNADSTIRQIVTQSLKQLELSQAITVAYCSPNQVAKSKAFNKDGIKKAIPVAVRQTKYLLRSRHWQAIKKLNSPYGCVFVYKYSKDPLTDHMKWQAMI